MTAVRHLPAHSIAARSPAPPARTTTRFIEMWLDPAEAPEIPTKNGSACRPITSSSGLTTTTPSAPLRDDIGGRTLTAVPKLMSAPLRRALPRRLRQHGENG